MVRSLLTVLSIALVTGCASTGTKPYQPTSPTEKEAFSIADKTISMEDVRANFNAYKRDSEIAWAGIIKKVQFAEKERSVQVGFVIEHHDFDWTKHSSGPEFQLSKESSGTFLAGWVVQKPTRISYLKQLAKPGDMIIVYGKPHRIKGSTIHIIASAIHPIPAKEFTLIDTP